MPPLFNELATDIEGEIVADSKTLKEYSNDSSCFEIHPQVIIYPKTTRDIEKVVSFSKTYHIPIAVYGKGNGGKGGTLSSGIVLDMHRYFDKLGKLTLQDSTFTVQAGALYKDCVKRLSTWGYTLPFVDHIEDMTIGGMVATNYKSSTALSVGGISDWVESLRIILDDGKEYLVDNNTSPYGRLLEIYGGIFSCLQEERDVIFSGHTGVIHQGMGYDIFTSHISPKMLMHFILGSEGTLGVITEITLRLDIEKKYSEGIALTLSSLDELPSLIDNLLHSYPTSFDGFDAKTLSLSSYTTKIINERHGNDVFTLFLVYSGDQDTVERSIKKTFATIPLPKDKKFICSAKELAVYRDIIFNQRKDLSTSTDGALTPLSLCNDLVFPTTSLSLALKEVQSVCEEYNVPYSTVIHAGTGVVRIETLFDIADENTPEIYIEMLAHIAKIVKWYRGAITYSYGDGIINTPVLPLIYGADVGMTLKKIKKVWDPSNIFNPGKKTTIDMSFLKKHFKIKNEETENPTEVTL